MNLGALPEMLIALLKNQGIDLGQPAKGDTSAFRPGQQYDARVLENGANGRSLVQIGKELLDMRFPQPPQPGESIKLTFLNASNRPTFLMQAPATSPAPTVRLSDAVQQVNALLRLAQTPAPPANSTATASRPMPVSASHLVSPAPPNSPLPATGQTTAPALPSNPTPTPMPSPGIPLARVLNLAPQPALTPSPTIAAAPSSAAMPPGELTVPSAPTSASATMANPARNVLAAMVAGTRPLVANPVALLGTPASAQALPLPGAALPAMTLAGQAVDQLRAALTSNTSVTAQGTVSQSSPGPETIALSLRKAVTESGLFYESHLLRWTRGQLPLESIQREPQALLKEAGSPLLKLPGLEGMPEEAAKIAGKQLILLEGGPLLWQGQAWPGQWMQWLIEEHPGAGYHPEDSRPRWRTEMKLTLPRLGEVFAELGVGAMGLRIRVVAPTPETLAEMNAALPDLAERLQAANLNLTLLQAELADAGPG
jgi:hypothetical protein